MPQHTPPPYSVRRQLRDHTLAVGRTRRQRHDHTKSTATQPYRTTEAAQQIARRLADEPVTPFPPTTQIRVYESTSRTVLLRRLAAVLSPRTRATLAALETERAERYEGARS